jgi:hypothetical protein
MILHREAGEGDHELVEGATAALHLVQFARIPSLNVRAVSASSTTLRAVPLPCEVRGRI